MPERETLQNAILRIPKRFQNIYIVLRNLDRSKVDNMIVSPVSHKKPAPLTIVLRILTVFNY